MFSWGSNINRHVNFKRCKTSWEPGKCTGCISIDCRPSISHVWPIPFIFFLQRTKRFKVEKRKKSLYMCSVEGFHNKQRSYICLLDVKPHKLVRGNFPILKRRWWKHQKSMMDVIDFDGLSNFISRMKMKCLKSYILIGHLCYALAVPRCIFNTRFPRTKVTPGDSPCSNYWMGWSWRWCVAWVFTTAPWPKIWHFKEKLVFTLVFDERYTAKMHLKM